MRRALHRHHLLPATRGAAGCVFVCEVALAANVEATPSFWDEVKSTRIAAADSGHFDVFSEGVRIGILFDSAQVFCGLNQVSSTGPAQHVGTSWTAHHSGRITNGILRLMIAALAVFGDVENRLHTREPRESLVVIRRGLLAIRGLATEFLFVCQT